MNSQDQERIISDLQREFPDLQFSLRQMGPPFDEWALAGVEKLPSGSHTCLMLVLGPGALEHPEDPRPSWSLVSAQNSCEEHRGLATRALAIWMEQVGPVHPAWSQWATERGARLFHRISQSGTIHRAAQPYLESLPCPSGTSHSTMPNSELSTTSAG